MSRFILITLVVVAAGGAAGYFFVAEPKLSKTQAAYRVELTETEVKLDGKFVHPIQNGDVPAKALSQGASYPLFHKANELIDQKKLRPNGYHVVEFKVTPKSTLKAVRRLMLSLQQLEVLQVHILEDDSTCGGAIVAALPILFSSADKSVPKSKGGILDIALAKDGFSVGIASWPSSINFGSGPYRSTSSKPQTFPYTQDGMNRFRAKANAWARGKPEVTQIGLSTEALDLPWEKARMVLCALRKKSDLAPLISEPSPIDRIRHGLPGWKLVGPYSGVSDHGVILWNVVL